MIKKLFKIVRILTIGILWSIPYFLIVSSITIYFWNFNMFSANSWHSVQNFWRHGGIIKEGKDYALIFTLLCAIPLYFTTWRKLCKKNFVELLLSPLKWYGNYINKKYSGESKRIVIKNMGNSNAELEEYEKRLNPTSHTKPDEEIARIRNAVQDKIKSAIEN